MLDSSKEKRVPMAIEQHEVHRIISGVSTVVKAWRTQHPLLSPLPKALYHYTSPAGLLGILSQGKMRATHVTCLNDHSEFFHVVDVMKKRLNSKLPTADQCRPLLDEIARQLAIMTPREMRGIFVICFADAENSLTHWKGYGGGVGGIAMGFDRVELEHVAYSLPNSRGLAPVEYCPIRQKDLVDRVLDWSCRAWSERLSIYSDTDVSEWVFALLYPLTTIAPLLKNEAFSDEKEWRIVIADAPSEEIAVDTNFRGLTAYVLANLCNPITNRLPLREIWAGPGHFPDRELVAAEVAARKFGYKSLQYDKSEIAFRP